MTFLSGIGMKLKRLQRTTNKKRVLLLIAFVKGLIYQNRFLRFYAVPVHIVVISFLMTSMHKGQYQANHQPHQNW